MTRQKSLTLSILRRGFRRVLCFVGLVVFAIGAEATTLDVFLSNIEKRSLQSDFTITITEDASQPMNYTGSLCMHGKCFWLSMFDTEASFDGSTLYLYSSTTDELTLSTPTEQELMEANPFLYAQALKQVCAITERPSKDPQQTTVVLTPRDAHSEIQRFMIRLKRIEGSGEQSVYLPLSIEIKEGKRVTTLTLKQPRYITTSCSFRLEYPDAFQNDLR